MQKLFKRNLRMTWLSRAATSTSYPSTSFTLLKKSDNTHIHIKYVDMMMTLMAMRMIRTTTLC